MARNLYQSTNESAINAIAENGKWLMGVPAIVADNQDPETQHRVRVIIPSIDEDMIYDEWTRQMVFCLGDGFGTAFIPPVNSEVVLFGQLGQKYNLFYASLYNEEMSIPAGFDSEMSVGIHAPGDLKFIAEEVAKILARNIEFSAEQTAKILAQNVEATAEQVNKVKGNNVAIEGNQTTFIKAATIDINGTTIKINGSGAVSIKGASVAISSTGAVTIEGRPVNKSGPPI